MSRLKKTHSDGRVIRLTAYLGLDFSAFRGADAVDKENSLKMIMFVLDGSGQEPISLEFYHPFQVLSSHANGTWADYICANAWETQASFDADLKLPETFYFGINQDQGHVVLDLDRFAANAKRARPVFNLANIEHAKLNRNADLLCG